MFHTLFDSQEEKSHFKHNYPRDNYQDSKNKHTSGNTHEYYFGKGNSTIDRYNRKKIEMEKDLNFEKTKYKIKLVVYRNGFILNNGPFRDRSISENNEFLEEVDKGNIPQELIRKGIRDLGILLINRKTEMFRSPLYNSLPTSFESYKFQYQNEQYPFEENENRNNGKARSKTMYNAAYIPQTPMGTRNQRNNIFFNDHFKMPNNNEEKRNKKRTNSLKKEKKIMTLSDFNNKNEKKFKPFSGTGQVLGMANIKDGIMVDSESITISEYSSSNTLSMFDEFSSNSQSENGTTFDEFISQNSLLSQIVY